MSDKSATIKKPIYMQKFKCIGGECEDSCCAGWRVVFDKKTTQSYLSAPHEEVRIIAKANIKKIKENRSSANYSFVQMNAQGACPFQQADKLCMIQGRMGEKALSKTCSTYPRHQGILDQGKVEVATLSCPEAARLCLLTPDAMQIEGRSRTLSFDENTPLLNDKQTPLVFLHSSAMGLLEDKRILPEEFILIYSTALNLLLKNSDKAFSRESRFIEFSTLVSHVQRSLASVRTSALKDDPAIRFQISKVMPLLIKRSRQSLLTNKRFGAAVIRCLVGLTVDKGDIAVSEKRYKEAMNSLTIHEKDTIILGFRNYLMNDLIKNSARYRSSGEAAFSALQGAAVRLCIFMFLVLGAKAADDAVSIADVLVEAVSSSARAFEHNTTLVDQIAALLDTFEKQSPAMLGLIAPKIQ